MKFCAEDLPRREGSGQVLAKGEKLIEILRAYTTAAVAFSGGVDSAVLLRAAREALGDRVIAVTAVSELLPRAELAEAKAVAAAIGARHVVLDVNDLENPALVANDKERCYHCKKARFTQLIDWAKQSGYHKVLEGSNLDDDGDYRPGMRAMAELADVESPLVLAGFHKAEIRLLAKEWNLSVWDKPSAACLASRIRYGLEITEARLRQVEQAEQILRARVGGRVRVRHHGDLARIEVEASDFAALNGLEAREALNEAFKRLGFTYVTLDLQGYRMGSQNEALKEI